MRKRLSMSNAMWGMLATKASIALRRSAVAAAARINSARRVAALLKTSRHTEKRNGAPTARKIASNVTRRHITAFLLEPNNSSCMPGKRDTVTGAGVKLQRYILNDTMYFLHQRCEQEHLKRPVSLATFKKARLAHALTVASAKHQVCLCLRHKNFAHLVAPLKGLGVSKRANEFIANYSDDKANSKVDEIPDGPVKYWVWRSVTDEHNGSPLPRTRPPAEDTPPC